jgi:adenine-specific DNA methylase
MGVYLAFGVSRLANRLSTICVWNRIGEKIEQVFKLQAIPMTWDYPETNVFSDSTGGWGGSLGWVPTSLEAMPQEGQGHGLQEDACAQSTSTDKLISTDPPYYDNVGYADLSDFFYVWLRRSLTPVFPDLFATLAVPKAEELVATPARHGGMDGAETFFLDGMTQAMHRLAKQAHPGFPVTALKAELPVALAHLQRGNIAPVDLAQAAIGPGMAVYTRYSKVLDAEGKPLSVREALSLINQTLDEALAEQEGDFDADSRWALAWFEQYGFEEGEYGVAETLSKAKNTSVKGLEEAGILEQGRGKVRLLRPEELPADWEPEKDPRLSAWETVHHLIRAVADGGEGAAAGLVAKLGTKAEVARELAYRLYTLCERKKRAGEALAYNGLVQSWPEIARLAGERGSPRARQSVLFEEQRE